MTIDDNLPVTHCMAGFAIDTSWDGLSERLQAESVRALMNWVACAVGGAGTPSMDAAVKGIMAMDGEGATPVLGRRERTGMSNAALLGCLSSSAHTFDDTHLATITHPTGPVAAAALAAAHTLSRAGNPVPGAALLNALSIGIELECRVSNAIAAGGGSSIGWYMTGLSGGIGAAAAVGRLLGLAHEQMIHAIGLAATQACGLRATHGSMAITYVPAVAARNGLVSAYMAQAGFTCSEISIDGRNGLLQVLSATADPRKIREGLGRDFELLNNTYKPYPCGIVIHPSIDACLELARNGAISPGDIERVDLQVHADALNLTWRKLPRNALDAQVSLYHWVAAALVRQAAGVEQGELECVLDPEVRALQEKLHVEVAPGLADNQAAVAVRLKDGRVFEARTENATGSVTNPMSNDQLIEKFRKLAGLTLDSRRCGDLLDFCLDMPAASDAAGIFSIGAG